MTLSMMATPLEGSCRNLPALLSHSGFLPGFLLLLVGDRGWPHLLWVSNTCSAQAAWGELKGFTLLRAAALRCVNSNQEPQEEDEAGWVLSHKISPVFSSSQLFISARCKGPDTRAAERGAALCVTHRR